MSQIDLEQVGPKNSFGQEHSLIPLLSTQIPPFSQWREIQFSQRAPVKSAGQLQWATSESDFTQRPLFRHPPAQISIAVSHLSPVNPSGQLHFSPLSGLFVSCRSIQTPAKISAS